MAPIIQLSADFIFFYFGIHDKNNCVYYMGVVESHDILLSILSLPFSSTPLRCNRRIVLNRHSRILRKKMDRVVTN